VDESSRVRRRSPASGAAVVVLLTVLPWAWFLVRDLLGPVGDVLAILFPVLVVVAVLAMAVPVIRRRRLRWLVPAASVLLLGAVAVVGPWTPDDAGAVAPAAATTIAGANVMGNPQNAGALLALSPDVLVVAEMTARLTPLLAAYPYREVDLGGPNVAVFSRLPIRVLERPTPELPGLRVEVQGPAGPFVLYALHVPRPWITGSGGYQATVAEHHAIMRSLAAGAAAETLPVVMVGDMNSPDRGRDYRQILRDGGLVDAMRDGWTTYSSTGKWRPFLLRIDHVLVSRGWCGDASHRFALPGSDHSGVTATVGPCVGRAGS
jgi:hypothetical protein